MVRKLNTQRQRYENIDVKEDVDIKTEIDEHRWSERWELRQKDIKKHGCQKDGDTETEICT